MTQALIHLPAEMVQWRCLICGVSDTGGNGRWACHSDEDCNPVCRGRCFRVYNLQKAEAASLAHWERMLELWGSAG